MDTLVGHGAYVGQVGLTSRVPQLDLALFTLVQHVCFVNVSHRRVIISWEPIKTKRLNHTGLSGGARPRDHNLDLLASGLQLVNVGGVDL